MIKFITFDLDGTIIDDEWAHEQAKTEIARSLGASGDLNLSYFTGRSNRLFWQTVCDMCNKTDANIEELTLMQFRRVLEILKENKQPESCGLTETMRYLKKNGYVIAVASGSDEFFVDGIIDLLKIRTYIDVKITKDFVHFVKPDPDIYLAAMREGGFTCEESLGIEDSKSGILALKSAGMKSVGYNDGKNVQDLSGADYNISAMTDIISLLEFINNPVL